MDSPRPLTDREPALPAELVRTLDRLPEAHVLLGDGGRIHFANRAAAAILEERDGIHLGVRDAQAFLSFTHRAAQERFAAVLPVIAEAGGCHGMRVARPSGKADLVIKFEALASEATRRSRVLTTLIDPARRPRLDQRFLSVLYALTQAEVRLAECLLCDTPIREIADELGIKESTARSQLISVFRKTGTSRQSELVRLLTHLRSAA